MCLPPEMLCTSVMLLLLVAAAAQQAAPQAISIDITGVGAVVVQPHEEPADVVELFAQQHPGIDFAAMGQIMGEICKARACARQLQDISLDVTGVGTIKVRPGEEPVDVVERFASQANAAGHNVDGNAMVQILAELCKRKRCNRTLQEVSLDVTGIGKIVVPVGQEPADVVEQFAAQAKEAGHNVDGNAMVQILTELCKLKQCNRLQLRPPQPAAP